MNSDDDFQPPEMPLAFDDEGRPVPVSHPAVYDADLEPDADGHNEFQAKLGAFLRWLTDGATVESAGRKALLIAHLAGQGANQTDAELAKRIGVSRARVSQLRREIANDFGRFARCNGRRA